MHETSAVRAVLADWGTSKLRMWAWSGGTEISAPVTDPRGMKFLAPADYPQVLAEGLEKLSVPPGVPVLICGMAGAAGGWQEAGYLEAPLGLAELGAGACRVDLPERDVRILPGVSTRSPTPDVMRGEETQILGLRGGAQTPLVCLPGTHSKWVALDEDRLTGFTTYMTGELFEVVSQHSILAKTLDEAWDASDFRTAVDEALADPVRVWQAFFGLRASVVLGAGQAASSRARLSGLLIGAECAAARAQHGPGKITLIAGGAMAQAYDTALRAAGFDVHLRDGEEVTRNGLIRAAQAIWRD